MIMDFQLLPSPLLGRHQAFMHRRIKRSGEDSGIAIAAYIHSIWHWASTPRFMVLVGAAVAIRTEIKKLPLDRTILSAVWTPSHP
jgi:hypothetical protein